MRATVCPRVVGATEDGNGLVTCGTELPCREHRAGPASVGGVDARMAYVLGGYRRPRLWRLRRWLVRVAVALGIHRCELCDEGPTMTGAS